MTFRGEEHPRASILPDGHRLHLQHGPIDLVIGAEGPDDEIEKSYRQAVAYFQTVLASLAGELDLLRQPCTPGMPPATGEIARHMQIRATVIGRQSFVTPMIAVAGAVADHVLQALLQNRRLRRAYVNNGGDIALWLGRNAHFDVGVCANSETGEIGSTARIRHEDGIGGIATSGWRGRSFSLGIADAVTVLANDATAADAAATLIANAVDVPGSPAIHRRPAQELAPDSDLRGRLVTVAVEALTDAEVGSALQRGYCVAAKMLASGQIEVAYLSLQDQTMACGQSSVRRRLATSKRLENTYSHSANDR